MLRICILWRKPYAEHARARPLTPSMVGLMFSPGPGAVPCGFDHSTARGFKNSRIDVSKVGLCDFYFLSICGSVDLST